VFQDGDGQPMAEHVNVPNVVPPPIQVVGRPLDHFRLGEGFLLLESFRPGEGVWSYYGVFAQLPDAQGAGPGVRVLPGPAAQRHDSERRQHNEQAHEYPDGTDHFVSRSRSSRSSRALTMQVSQVGSNQSTSDGSVSVMLFPQTVSRV
jgi:hypothetical protein